MNLITTITCEQNINDAYEWLCKKRKKYSANSDVWYLRRHWQEEKIRIQQTLRHGTWRFSPVSLYKIDGEIRSVWSAVDALVLRAIAQVLGQHLAIHPDCLHVKGNGGVAGGLKFVEENYKKYTFFYRSDVKGYYRHIRHGVLVRQLDRQIKEKRLLHVLRRYLNRVDTFAGFYATRIQGLNKGCPLAPLMGALYLTPLDKTLSRLGPYKRFMDDWILFANKRTIINQGVNETRYVLGKLGMQTHPDKTWVGRVEKGFVFLGSEFIH